MKESQKGFVIPFIIAILAIMVIGGVFVYKNKISKENNLCSIDSDCSYIWYTGGCYTPEYVAKKVEEAEKEGVHIGEAPFKEGVVCACVSGKCSQVN